jgi:hypothetical protein
MCAQRMVNNLIGTDHIGGINEMVPNNFLGSEFWITGRKSI